MPLTGAGTGYLPLLKVIRIGLSCCFEKKCLLEQELIYESTKKPTELVDGFFKYFSYMSSLFCRSLIASASAFSLC